MRDSNTYIGTLSMGAINYYIVFGDSTYITNALCYYSLGDLNAQLVKQI